MVSPITKMMGAMMMHQPMRTKLYPKKGKPHIYKDRFGWNVVWVPGTTGGIKIAKAVEFINHQLESK